MLIITAYFISIVLTIIAGVLDADLITMLTTQAADSQALLAAIIGTLSPLKLIDVVSNICFGLVLGLVIRAFFQIRWLKAFCSVSIPYAIYWTLNKVFQSVFQFN